MALIRCVDCGKDFSDAASACPHCGRPNAPSSSSSKKRKAPGCLAAGCLTIVIIGFVSAVIGRLDSSKVRDQEADRAATAVPRIPYRVVQQWEIPNGGYGKVVVIDSSHRNAKDLRTLGENLKLDAANDRNAGVEVFDDLRAAKMRQDAVEERLGPKALAYHDKHKIAFYDKNGNTGFHEYRFTLINVMSDQWTVIRY